MYNHNATKILCCLRGAKISWTPTLTGVSYQFGCIHFSICLQCKTSGSSFFNFFSHDVSHHKVRKVMNPSFLKKVQMGLAFLIFCKENMLAKNIVLELWSKNLKRNQNARFFKLQYLRKSLRYEVVFLDKTRGPRKHQMIVGWFK